MLKYCAGNYYLGIDGYVYKITHHIKIENRYTISKLGTYQAATHSAEVLKTLLIKDLGNNAKVVRLLLGDSVRGA